LSSTGPDPDGGDRDRDELLDHVYARARRLWWRRRSMVAGATAFALLAVAVPVLINSENDSDDRRVAAVDAQDSTTSVPTSVAPETTTTTTVDAAGASTTTTLRRPGVTPTTTTTLPALPPCTPAENPRRTGTIAIAFYTSRAGDYDIWITDMLGNDRSLTPGRAGSQRDPALRSGQIAYVDDATGSTIHVLDVATGNDRNLGLQVGAGGSPAWSQDGQHLAYATGGGQIRVAKADGSDSRLLVDGTDPSWAPDGRSLAFSRDDGIWSVNADGAELRRLGPGHSPAWGFQCRLAYADQGDVWILEFDGSRHNITNDPANDDDPAWPPPVGPDVAFTTTRTGSVDIWTAESVGGGSHPVTTDSGDELGPSWHFEGAS
jgi:hypothetical protein